MKKLFLIISLVLFATSAMAADVTLKWDPVADATGYKIYSSLDLGVTWDAGIDTAGATTFIVTGVPDTGKVLFRVSAFNEHGEAVRYNAMVMFCNSCQPPPAPTGVGVE